MSAPLMEALRALEGRLSFHMPGHKGLRGELELWPHMDVTELERTDDLYRPDGPIARAQELMAHSARAARTILLTNGSTCGVEAMLGNGMVLRETITSPTLAYLQMAHSAMELAARSEAPGVELQWVLDDIMAFRGSFDDSVEAETTRNITKVGSLVERISLMLRLDWQLPRLERELLKLLARLRRTDLAPEAEALEVIERAAAGEAVERGLLLASVEGLLRV